LTQTTDGPVSVGNGLVLTVTDKAGESGLSLHMFTARTVIFPETAFEPAVTTTVSVLLPCVTVNPFGKFQAYELAPLTGATA